MPKKDPIIFRNQIPDTFVVIVADNSDRRFWEIKAGAAHVDLGRAAYDAACEAYPTKYIALQNGAHVMKERKAPPPISRLPAPIRGMLAMRGNKAIDGWEVW